MTFVEGISHRKPSNESFKMCPRSQSYGVEPSDLLRRKDHSSKSRQRTAWKLARKKKGHANCQAHPIKVSVWGCFSSQGFGPIVCFKQNLNAEFMHGISKRGLLPTAWKQFGHGSTLWKLQEDNEPKHTRKLAVK